MGKKLEFEAEILQGDMGGAYVKIPFDLEEVYGKKRVKVKAKFDGAFYRGSAVRMKTPYHILIVRKDIQQQIGKGVGDLVQVAMEEDLEQRTVELPASLQKALKDSKLLAAWKKSSFTFQREALQAVESAKRPETVERRIQKILSELADKA
jgi:hypothetical protein